MSVKADRKIELVFGMYDRIIEMKNGRVFGDLGGGRFVELTKNQERSMSGFNLPPGVSESMLPGNRPEDEQAERLANTLAEAVRWGWTTKEVLALWYEQLMQGHDAPDDFATQQHSDEEDDGA